jgi:hypothetical protein
LSCFGCLDLALIQLNPNFVITLIVWRRQIFFHFRNTSSGNLMDSSGYFDFLYKLNWPPPYDGNIYVVERFLKQWWVESDFKAPNLPLSLRLNIWDYTSIL